MMIGLVAVGEVRRSILDRLATAVSATLQMKVDVSPVCLPLPAPAWDEDRGQYQSEIVLADLMARSWPSQMHVLAVADVDLYASGLSFVFGQASCPGTVAVMSLHRLEPVEPPATLLDRAAKEAVHELGHTFGLTHCDDPGCVMFLSHNLGDTDRKSPGFCAACRAQFDAASGRQKGES
jgi:archaemetzincin